MKLTVLGAGCWGLTLAWLMTDNFDDVVVWGRSVDLSDELKEKKVEAKYSEEIKCSIYLISCRSQHR